MKLTTPLFAFIIAVSLFSCRKETSIVINQVAEVKDIDSVDLEIYLLDYDSIDLGNVNAAGHHVFNYQNTNNFYSSYGITRCNGVMLDSFALTYADSVYSLNMNPVDSTPDFSFNNVLTYCMPNIIEDVRINRNHTTSLEIWNTDIIGHKVKLATFLVGPYGIYGEVTDNAVSARSYLTAEHSFKTLTTL
ncbi:MAG: hypothetical protein JWO09_143 [Bacteroidetes bacterium]|nr:hypothetical protein [Bacteroidota bacterium]